MKKILLTALSLSLGIASSAIADNVANLNTILIKADPAHKTAQAGFYALFPQLDPQVTAAPACAAANNRATYTLAGLQAALTKFPQFLNSGDEPTNARELAAFFANTSHETNGGWATAPQPYAWGLCYTHELGCPSTTNPAACAYGGSTAPGGLQYYGRGPIQLSYPVNYAGAGAALEADLKNNPDQVLSSAETAWGTALWFWMTPQAPKPSAHAVITAKPGTAIVSAGVSRPAGFGLTIDIINGGVECNQGQNAEMLNRIGYYEKWFGPKLGATTDPATDSCANIPVFGAAAKDKGIKTASSPEKNATLNATPIVPAKSVDKPVSNQKLSMLKNMETPFGRG